MTDHRDPLRDDLRRSRLQYHLKIVTNKVVEILQVIVAVGGLLLAVALQIPWLRKPLERIGLEDTGGTIQTILVFVVVAAFFEVRSLRSTLDGTREQRHFANPIDVYPVLLSRMRSISRKEEKKLDVLGMTLYTAWPTITFWLNQPELSGWTIRLTAVLYSDKGIAGLIPREWFQESVSNLKSVAEAAKVPSVIRRDITLEPYGYDFMPVVHGFRLGNGDLFFSILSWQDDGRIGRESYSYEYIPCEDHSESAQAMRAVFDSWFERARKTPWHAAADLPTIPQPGNSPENAGANSSTSTE